jgi:hypothetical protein
MTHDPSNPTNVPRGPTRLWAVCAAGLVGLGTLWAYAPTLATLVHRWVSEPRYSHGFVVPALALVVWWVRRHQAPVREYRPSWWGIAFLAGAGALRLAAVRFYVEWFDGLSLLPVLLGFCLLAGGWPLFRQAAPAVALLVFMLPFPFQVEGRGDAVRPAAAPGHRVQRLRPPDPRPAGRGRGQRHLH